MPIINIIEDLPPQASVDFTSPPIEPAEQAPAEQAPAPAPPAPAPAPPAPAPAPPARQFRKPKPAINPSIKHGKMFGI